MNKLKYFLAALFAALLLLAQSAYAATYTSTQAGNWNAAATWGGGGSPNLAGGDKAVVNHAVAVNVNAIIGDDAAGVVLSGSGTLTINGGTTFTLKGWAFDANLNITMQANSTLSVGTGYFIYCHNFITQGTAWTAGNFCTISSLSPGANNGFFYNGGSDGVTLLNLAYTYVDDFGSPSFHNQIGTPVVANNVRFRRNRYYQIAPIGAAEDINIVGVEFSGSLDFTNLLVDSGMVAATTGLRTINNCAFDKGAIIGGNAKNLILEQLQTDGDIVVGTNGVACGAITRIKNVCAVFDPSNPAMLTVYGSGVITRNAIHLLDSTHGLDLRPQNVGTYEVSENVFENGSGGAGADSIVVYNDTASPPATTTNAHNNINLASPDGLFANTLLNHASSAKNLTLTINHNTSAGEIAISQGGGIAVDSSARNGLLTSCQSNILAAGVGGEHYLLEMYNPDREPRTGAPSDAWDKGTLTAVDATSFTDSTASWGTTFSDLPTSFYILFTNGAASGKATLITANVSGIKGSVSAWNGSVTPGVGDAYIIVVADVFDPANVGHNCHFHGLSTGKIHRLNGTDVTSVQGYDGYYITSGAPGASDLWATNPQFADRTRHIATYDIDGLGNAAGTGWVTATPYVVGDIVSSATSTFYGNKTINYRCIAAHTSEEESTKPGSGALWPADWEYATVHRMRQDRTLIDGMITWIQNGYKPRTHALWLAGHDGATIGAMDASGKEFTSKANGNWSAGDQTTWNEVGVPGDNDTATLSHNITITADLTIGSSLNTGGTPAIQWGFVTGKTLTVNPGVVVNCLGDYQSTSTYSAGVNKLIVGAGSPWTFTPPSGQQYGFSCTGDAQSSFEFNGLVGSRVTVSVDTSLGGLNGYMSDRPTDIVANYTDFTNLGTDTRHGLYGYVAGTSPLSVTNCTFTGCNAFFAQHPSSTVDLFLTNCKFLSSVYYTADGFWEGVEVSTSGASAIFHVTANSFDLRPLVVLTDSGRFAGNFIDGPIILPGSSWTNKLCFYKNVIWGANSTALYGSNTGNFFINITTTNPHFVGVSGSLIEDAIFEAINNQTDNVDSGDCIFPAGGFPLTIQGCLTLPTFGGTGAARGAGVLFTHQAVGTAITVRHNTCYRGGDYNEVFLNNPGDIAFYQSNLIWFDVAGGSKLLDVGHSGPTDIVSPANCDYNAGWNMTAVNNGYTGTFSSTPGAHDKTVSDPFFDKTRCLATWAASQGQATTAAAAKALLAADPSLITQANTGLLDWVRAGFKVTGSQGLILKDAGSDNVTIGAMGYQAPPSTGSGDGVNRRNRLLVPGYEINYSLAP